MSRPLRVTIIGAGIGGLSAAVALRKIGADVTVVERAPELRAAGAGICMWPNGAQALHALGIANPLEMVSPILHRVCYRDQHGRVIREMSIDKLTELVGQRPFPLARSDLQAALLSRLDPALVRLGGACVSVEQDANGVRAVLDDGTEIASDLLVGADGIRSVVRNHVTGGTDRLRYHYTTWLGLVSFGLNLTPPGTFTFHVQDSKRVGLLNVGDDRLYFFFDAVPSGEANPDGVRAELRHHFDGWCSEVTTLVEALDEAKTNRLPVHDLDPLASFVNGRIVLIGDAAHATTPTLGQGGALAMEDSLVLARHLAESTDYGSALASYDNERLMRTRQVVLASRARTAATLGIDNTSAQTWQKQLTDDASQDFLEQLVDIHRAGPLAAWPHDRQEGVAT
ncbi:MULTISPECIES: FAD-dependent monooxygenase [Aminobacter]|uniref:TmuM n=1 Tax=Pseudomonas sp. (strain CBB1) TaxID=765715 RepID=I7ASS7_PSEU3|nr:MULTISPECIES: FAD-dependent monooxygenase [Aminobacter]AFO10115.1 TmuM [Pseudomonas sp. CBB1]MDR7224610.1 FAD-dependent urate hydroxylase [Aminobacter aminovorans]QNH33935.1 FAD-dependent monooxygenase [Aminobacter sp. MDW-2]